MGLFDLFSDWFGSHINSASSDIDGAAGGCGDSLPMSDSLSDSMEEFAVNPANGLPMIGGTGGVDVAGNPYGFDSSHDSGSQDLYASSGLDEIGSCDSSFGSDDSWSSSSGDCFSDW